MTVTNIDTTTGMQATRLLAEQVNRLRFEDLPQVVVEAAKASILDSIGCSIAGASDEAAELIRASLAVSGSTGAATASGTSARTSPYNAAFVNGISTHILDFDDTAMEIFGHPSAPMLPAVLADAEVSGASGRDVIAAYVAGAETQARIGLAFAKAHYLRGFHSTATLGVFGAAAALSSLRSLDVERTAHAFGLAGIQSSGLKNVFGSMGKSFQVGHAAAAGWLAGDLAARGYTSTAEVLAGETGYANMYSGVTDLAAIAEPFGPVWYTPDALFKPYASCYATHALFDGLTAFTAESPDFGPIERIDVVAPIGHMGSCNIPEPASGLEGKFSLAYVASLALLRGTAGVADFTDDSVRDPELVEMLRRVRVVGDDRQTGMNVKVTVTGADGRATSFDADNVEAARRRPRLETWNLLAAKFVDLATPVIGSGPAGRVVDAVGALEHLADIRELMALTGTPTD